MNGFFFKYSTDKTTIDIIIINNGIKKINILNNSVDVFGLAKGLPVDINSVK